MGIIEEAHRRLFPGRTFSYQAELFYNRRLSDFNANISLHRKKLVVKMNLQWKSIDDEIKIGLVQSLLLKIFKEKNMTTLNIDLYNDFVKKIPEFYPKNKCDPMLKEVFDRVNGNLFSGMIEKPNLEWGQHSIRKLASYNFHNDTITVSKVFEKSSERVLDLLMYHEMLHKQLQFKQQSGRNSYHSPEFRKAESLFHEKEDVEKEIGREIRKHLRSKKRPARPKNPFQRKNPFSFLKNK